MVLKTCSRAGKPRMGTDAPCRGVVVDVGGAVGRTVAARERPPTTSHEIAPGNVRPADHEVALRWRQRSLARRRVSRFAGQDDRKWLLQEVWGPGGEEQREEEGGCRPWVYKSNDKGIYQMSGGSVGPQGRWGREGSKETSDKQG